MGQLQEAGVTEAPPEDSGDLLAGRSPVTCLECAGSIPRVSIPGSTLPPPRRPGGRISNRVTKTLFGGHGVGPVPSVQSVLFSSSFHKPSNK